MPNFQTTENFDSKIMCTNSKSQHNNSQVKQQQERNSLMLAQVAILEGERK